jgi:hypothetical protein
MKKGKITRFKLNPAKPPKTDWRRSDTMSEDERYRAALSDPDAPLATEAQLARARRAALRSNKPDAEEFRLPLE